jgi:hypothetical protein
LNDSAAQECSHAYLILAIRPRGGAISGEEGIGLTEDFAKIKILQNEIHIRRVKVDFVRHFETFARRKEKVVDGHDGARCADLKDAPIDSPENRTGSATANLL